MRIIILLAFVGIIVSLGSALVFLVRDGGGTSRTVNALTVRVGLSVALFGTRPWLDFIASATGNFLYGAKASFFFDFYAQWVNNSLNGLFTQILLAKGASRSLALPLVLRPSASSWPPSGKASAGS